MSQSLEGSKYLLAAGCTDFDCYTNLIAQYLAIVIFVGFARRRVISCILSLPSLSLSASSTSKKIAWSTSSIGVESFSRSFSIAKVTSPPLGAPNHDIIRSASSSPVKMLCFLMAARMFGQRSALWKCLSGSTRRGSSGPRSSGARQMGHVPREHLMLRKIHTYFATGCS